MTGKLYLPQAVDIKEITHGKLNLIIANSASGKTYFALNELPKLKSKKGKCLYLIDLNISRDRVLTDYKSVTIPYSKAWENHIEDGGTETDFDNKIAVLTYREYGEILSRKEHFIKCFDVIICDELDGGIKQLCYGNESVKTALTQLKYIIWKTHIKVITVTSTPNRIIERFKKKEIYKSDINKITVNKDIREYETHNTVKYTDIDSTVKSLPLAAKGIIFIGRVTQAQKTLETLTDKGINAVALWSPYSEHTMTKEQYRVRDYIIENKSLPPEYDVLIINDSYVNAISIESHIDYIIIHRDCADTQIQVRGRYKNDLQTMYVRTNGINNDIEVPIEFLDIPLFNTEQAELLKVLGITKVKFPTLRKRLEKQGYIVKEGDRVKNCRCWIIKENEEITNSRKLRQWFERFEREKANRIKIPIPPYQPQRRYMTPPE